MATTFGTSCLLSWARKRVLFLKERYCSQVCLDKTPVDKGGKYSFVRFVSLSSIRVSTPFKSKEDAFKGTGSRENRSLMNYNLSSQEQNKFPWRKHYVNKTKKKKKILLSLIRKSTLFFFIFFIQYSSYNGSYWNCPKVIFWTTLYSQNDGFLLV